MNKKTFKYIIFASIIGILIGKYVFDQSKDEAKSVINDNNYVYLMQYGAFKDIENMNNGVSGLKNYIYVKEDDGYHVYVGISKSEKIIDKVNDILGYNNIYNKKVNINNIEFLEVLDQYDTLIEQTDDNEVIINAQKQILSKYEELILQNE